MNSSTTLLRWLRRARPGKRALATALANGAVATLANVGLLVGAVGLLVDSATRPGLRAVAVALVAIEIVAFLRSPLRFFERMSAHRLGYDAVTTWRRWLVTRVGALDYGRWRQYALGDVLERSLRDTDELQMLWLRGVIPLVDTSLVLVVGDVVVALLPPFGHWWAVAAQLFIIQCIAVGALSLVTRIALRRDRALRRARAQFRAELVELGSAAPALALLGRLDVATHRLIPLRVRLAASERQVHTLQRASALVVTFVAAASVNALVERPRAALLWSVVVGAYCLANLEAFIALRAACHALVAVSGGAERLDAFDVVNASNDAAWPNDPELRADKVTLSEDERELVQDLSWSLPARGHLGVTGPSGVGKSTLLRALAGLDEVASGSVSYGGVPVRSLNEGALRQHVVYVPSEPGFARGYALDVATLGRGDVALASRLLDELGVAHTSDTYFEELSRGELARVALVRALVGNPDVVLLDEPSAGLGAAETRRLLNVLASREVTVVVASHDPEVLAWCDQVLTLSADELSR